ncbi:MAG: winged helix-turn-helix transcriptional regulator [Rhodobacteraceae bacterium]|nr:winged helix-turn-helix transcriptional regulator [Paracoccaceae bacterium]
MRMLDNTDRDLLKLLRHNARTTVTELAATLSLTRATVKSRMSALLDDGVIHRFTIETADAADEDHINAISMLEIELAKVEKVHRTLKRLPEITSLHTTNGKWALVARSETRNLTAFDRLLNQIGRVDGVANVETCLLLTRLS